MTARRPRASPARGYKAVLAEVTQNIATARRRALSVVNAGLVGIYWDIGRIVVRQQETAHWGDAVVEKLAADLRAAFPDMKGLSRDNLWRMRQFFLTCRDTEVWLKNVNSPTASGDPVPEAAVSRLRHEHRLTYVPPILGTASRELRTAGIPGAPPPDSVPPRIPAFILALSWSHHTIIMGAAARPDERYFYTTMAARERWSVRELRRQIDADLFTRYVSVRSNPEKCLPAKAEKGDLLPFKDHYVLEFLGLAAKHSEQQLRRAILANLRDFFLEFGRDFTLVGEEYPLAVGTETFRVDLLFFHRRMQCLVAVELKIGGFKPEYVGKSLFYVAALDEQVRLPHENPSIGLILCKSADRVQLRLALTAAAKKIGVATYQTALPNERQIRDRLRRLPALPEADS